MYKGTPCVLKRRKIWHLAYKLDTRNTAPTCSCHYTCKILQNTLLHSEAIQFNISKSFAAFCSSIKRANDDGIVG